MQLSCLGAIALLAGLGSQAMAEAPSPCRPASLAVRVKGDRPMLDIAIDDRPAHMVLDTGTSQTLLLADAPARLGLPAAADHPPEQRLSYGKAFEVRFVRIRRIDFAGVTKTMADLPVATGGGTEAGVDGFFMDDRLQQADFDFAGGRVDLYCDGAPAWIHGPDVFSVPLEDKSRLFGQALVNGQAVRVLFDTGSPVSSMTLAAATRTGVPVGATSDAGEAGIGMDTPLRAWTTRIAGISLGGRVADAVPVEVVDKPNASADMIAGFDFFLRHRVWIDRMGRRLVFRAGDDPHAF